MPVDIISIPLGCAGLAVGAFRVIHRARYCSPNLTVLSFALGAALLCRSPWLGDQVLDTALGDLTGWWNIPDLAGHLLTLLAAGAAIAYFARAAGFSMTLWTTYWVLAAIGIVCVAVYARSPAQDIQTDNMVNLPGMTAYSATFSLGLLVTHVFGLFIARRAQSATGWKPVVVALVVGPGSGIVMAVHRLLVVAFPGLHEVFYGPITWLATLGCIGGYITAAALVSIAQRADRAAAPGVI